MIVFIFPEKGSGLAAFGYASHRWCIDLLEWALSGEVPAERKHEILGLLLGYSRRRWHATRKLRACGSTGRRTRMVTTAGDLRWR